MMLYANRMMCNSKHFLRGETINYMSNNLDVVIRTPPSMRRIISEFYKMELCPNMIDTIDYTTRMEAYKVNTDTELKRYRKDELHSHAWKFVFSLMLEKYKDYLHIYTDGSKRDNLNGAGAWVNGHKILARLPEECSILTCELYAILIGLQFTKFQNLPIVIFSDSYSAMQALENHHNIKNGLVQKIIQAMKTYKESICIAWIPSHTGIEGNEKADETAKEARY